MWQKPNMKRLFRELPINGILSGSYTDKHNKGISFLT